MTNILFAFSLSSRFFITQHNMYFEPPVLLKRGGIEPRPIDQRKELSTAMPAALPRAAGMAVYNSILHTEGNLLCSFLPCS